MAARIPTSLEVAADPRSYNVARPLFGRTVAGIENQLNYLTGSRGLRSASEALDFTGSDLPGAGAMASAGRLAWVVSPLGRYVWWGGFVAPLKGSGLPAATVYVYAETPAGVLIDGPVQFTVTNGRLTEQQYYAHATAPAYGASQARDMFIHTGWATAAAGNAPRLLDVDGYQGLDVVIRVVATDTRLYSHTALEAYRSSI